MSLSRFLILGIPELVSLSLQIESLSSKCQRKQELAPSHKRQQKFPPFLPALNASIAVADNRFEVGNRRKEEIEIWKGREMGRWMTRR